MPHADPCRLARLLRSIPAADSERWALTGLDPTHLAMLALKDAQRGSAEAPHDDGSFHRRVVRLPQAAYNLPLPQIKLQSSPPVSTADSTAALSI